MATANDISKLPPELIRRFDATFFIDLPSKSERIDIINIMNRKFGIVKRSGNYILVWDYYHAGGLTQKIGSNAGILKQAYTIAGVRKEARRKGYRVREKKMDQGVRMVLTV